jgi:hypothetical protein
MQRANCAWSLHDTHSLCMTRNTPLTPHELRLIRGYTCQCLLSHAEAAMNPPFVNIISVFVDCWLTHGVELVDQSNGQTVDTRASVVTSSSNQYR